MKMLIMYRKAGLRFAVLALLGMTLALVAKPNHAYAITPCQSGCLILFHDCQASCQTPAQCQACSVQETDCSRECIHEG